MNKLLTLLLGGLAMLGPLAIDTYLPSFPAIGDTFNLNPVFVQQTLSVYLFTFAFMMLFHGTLSDSFGRRPVILVSLAIYTIASFGAAFAPNFGSLLIFRGMQGLAAGAGSVVGRAVVRDLVSGPEAQRVLSYITLLFALSPAIAPIIGGWMQVFFGWRSIFILLGIFGILIWFVTLRSLPESLPRQSRQSFHLGSIVRNYWKALSHPKFVFLAIAVGLSFGGFALYIGSASRFVINILHLKETQYGWMFIPLVCGMVIGSIFAVRLATRVRSQSLIWSGYGIMAAAAIANVAYNFIFPAAVPWAILPLMLYTFGLALATPAMMLTALDFLPENRGLAASLQSFVQMLVFALVSGIAAPLLFDSAFKLACGVFVGLVASLICWIFGRPRETASATMSSGIAV